MILYDYFEVDILHSMISIQFYKMSKIRMKFIYSPFIYFFHLLNFSVPTGNNTEDNERQQKIKILERLKFHMAKQMPKTPNIQVRCLIYFKSIFSFFSVFFISNGIITSTPFLTTTIKSNQ